jgi:hypothetical protein
MATLEELFMGLTGPGAWDQARGVPAGWTQGDPVTWQGARPGLPSPEMWREALGQLSWAPGAAGFGVAQGLTGGGDMARAGGAGGPWMNPYDPRNPAQQARVLRARQDQRRYGGSPVGGGRSYEDFMQRAQVAQYGPWLGNMPMPPTMARGPQGSTIGPDRNAALTPPPPAPPDPNAWAQGSMWQYRPGGPGILSGIPREAWPDYLDTMDATLPWAELAQYGLRDQAARDQWLMEYQRAGDQWRQQFGAGQDQASFDRWLAQQQLGLQAGQAGQDNAWRQRQLDLQQQMQQFQMGPQWQQQVGQQNWENQYRDRDWQAVQAQQGWTNQFARDQFGEDTRRWGMQFDAGRDDELWQRGFARDQFGEDTRRWGAEFQAGRDDALWGRGFQERQFGEDTRRYDQDFARNQALDAWNQTFAQGQFDWQKQRGVEQDALQREMTAMSSFGRRFGPAVGSM